LTLVIVTSAATAAGAHPADAAHVTFSAVPATAPLVRHYTVDQARTPNAPTTGAVANRATASGSGTPVGNEAFGARETGAVLRRGALRTGRSGPIGVPSGAPGSIPAPIASFPGMQSSTTICPYFPAGCNPPDMALAASPRFVLQGVNSSFEVLDTRGHVQPGWPRSAQAFFDVPNVPGCDPGSGNQPFLSDPRAFYDPADGRFWAAMLQVEGAIGVGGTCPIQSIYYIAVSQTGDPRGAWNVYAFDMTLGTTNVADFTQVGFDAKAVYFSANMFNNTGTAYQYAELFEANKALMERGSGAFTAAGFRSLTVTGPGATFVADTVQPVLTLGRGADGEYFVDTYDTPDPVTGNQCLDADDACRGLALWTLRNPTAHDTGGPLPTLTGRHVPDTLPYVYPPAANQPGCTACVDASDLRISATPVYRDGRVYAAWETGVDNGTQVVPGIEYAQVNTARATARSSYYVGTGDTAVSFPALMPAEDGRIVMVYDRMSSTINPEVRYVVTRVDTARFIGPGTLLKAGEAPYRPGVCGTEALPVCRWGDYSAASTDATARIWIAGEYANRNVGPSTEPGFSSRNWGTWIGGLAAG
jgi:hypothetical protein